MTASRGLTVTTKTAEQEHRSETRPVLSAYVALDGVTLHWEGGKPYVTVTDNSQRDGQGTRVRLYFAEDKA